MAVSNRERKASLPYHFAKNPRCQNHYAVLALTGNLPPEHRNTTSYFFPPGETKIHCIVGGVSICTSKASKEYYKKIQRLYTDAMKNIQETETADDVARRVIKNVESAK